MRNPPPKTTKRTKHIEDVEKYKLGDPRTFHYLNQSNCYELDGVNDSKEYLATRRAMNVVGISSVEQDAIFRVVAAVLHLGNIEFAKGQEIDSSEPKDDKSRFHLRMAAELFMCDEKSLEDSLCKRVIVTRDETITKWLDPDSAAVSRDALAKIVYSRLFDWIVDKINNSIGQDPDSKVLIGVLDIYGFESFKTNSFEQFCINLTNEKLQQHFNQHVFKMEQEEYTKEEIDWSYIDYVDNQDILDLIEKKPGGIIALLDEACMFPRSTHETFSQKLYQTFKSHKRFSKPKLSPTDFTIYHYAGDVTYQTEHFLDKNKDYVVAEHQSLLSASRCSFVADLFPPLPEESSKTSKFSSIGSRFKQQLQSLLETLSATEPHYVRCVKPNNLLKPSIFENNNVLQQLRCGGVLEAIRISCAGYPTRRTFVEFIARFGILAPDVLKGSCDEVTTSKRILEKVDLKGYQIGKTKVFLRAGQMAELDARRNEVLGRSASIIQRKVRSYLTRKSFVLLRQSAIQIQASCRVQVACHRYEKMRKEAACQMIQKDLRMYLARKAYNRLCSSAVSIQTGMRVMGACNELRFRKQTKAAIIIQSRCRGYLAHLHYLRIKKAAISTQCAWRGKVARRELRKLKIAAKETGALQAAKTMLEKQVEELTCQLQLEKRMRADIEEAKTQENAKLQNALQEMQVQFQETKEMLIKERENAKKADEKVPIIQEVPAIDHEMMNKLTAENEKLKDLVSSLEKKIDETQRKYEETNKISEERLKQALDAESKIIQLKTDMQRLEEKLSDMETEDQILRQQVSLHSPVGKMSEHLAIASEPHLENGHHGTEEKKTSEPESATPVKKFGTESDNKLRKSQIERQHESVDSLIKCVSQDLGFSNGKPVAAVTIYKCLLHWKSFEAEKTSVFDRLIQMIGSAFENQDNNEHMAYWLSNTSTLLLLLQRSLRTTGAASLQQKPPPAPSLFGRMAQVEAKYPALLFKQQLTAYVETIYGIIRDNLKKDLSSVLSSCIQVYLTLRSRGFVVSVGFGKEELDWLTEHLKKAVELEDTRGFTRKFRGENKIHLMEICFNNKGRFMKITEIATRRKPLLLVIPEGVKEVVAEDGLRSGVPLSAGKWARAVICECKEKVQDWTHEGKVIARMMGVKVKGRPVFLRRWSPRENMIIPGKFRRGWLALKGLPFYLWEEDQLKFILKKWGGLDLTKVKLWVEMHPNVVLPALLEVEDGAWKYIVAVSVIGEEGEDDIVTSETTHCRYEWLKEGGCVSQTTKFAEGLRGSIRGNECYSRELLPWARYRCSSTIRAQRGRRSRGLHAGPDAPQAHDAAASPSSLRVGSSAKRPCSLVR
ncbi:hypothetical protein AAG906_017875 [Vitis piasezkii]